MSLLRTIYNEMELMVPYGKSRAAPLPSTTYPLKHHPHLASRLRRRTLRRSPLAFVRTSSLGDVDSIACDRRRVFNVNASPVLPVFVRLRECVSGWVGE